MVIHAPEEEEVTTLQQMTDKLLDPGTSFILIDIGIIHTAIILLRAVQQ